jgi:hypothetical protein
VVVAPALVRIELFRAGRTCQLLITKHEPGKVENNRRPLLENRILFRGVNGLVDLDLLRTGGDLAGRSVTPEFWSRAGETLGIPAVFAAAVGGNKRCELCRMLAFALLGYSGHCRRRWRGRLISPESVWRTKCQQEAHPI